jgi:UDP-2-acetamido-2,6-beta-L-arabino-hexul-4-ose reductase
MKIVLVTGASGFIGKNLCSQLSLLGDDVKVTKFTRDQSIDDLATLALEADFIYHIAGVNRPENEDEFTTGNTDLTKHIIDVLRSNDRKTPLLLTSSAQAIQDNPYGKSKLAAEQLVKEWSEESGAPVYIYRLPGVFGKWCRPNYNSVVATFCNNIAHELPVQVSDPSYVLTLVYIDDVVRMFIDHLDKAVDQSEDNFYAAADTFEVSLGDLKDRISAIHAIRDTSIVPNLEDKLNKYLYATYISYLDTDKFSYDLTKNSDDRGWLAEFIKSRQAGQIFISKTKPGISRGDHWHHTKIEKFLVVEGKGEISFRNKIGDQDIISYQVDGDSPTVLDIPTGYVHAIKNIGSTDLITIFWANEMLDKERPDTYFEKVTLEESQNE